VSTGRKLELNIVQPIIIDGVKNFGNTTKKEDSYYQPIPLEYRLGFCCEIDDKETTGGWQETRLSELDIINLMKDGCKWNVRVKYLNESDIIENDKFQKGVYVNVWSEDNELIDGYAWNINKNDAFILFHDTKTNVVGIYLQRIYNEITGNWTSDVVFTGRIRNKSELSDVLVMLGLYHRNYNY